MVQLLEIPTGFKLWVALECRWRGHGEQQYPAVETALHQLRSGVAIEEIPQWSAQFGHEFRSDRSVPHLLPIDRGQLGDVETVLFHPVQQGAGAVGDCASLDHVVYITVLAGPVDSYPVLAGGLPEYAHALQDHPFDVPDLGRVGQSLGHCLLAGNVHVLPLPRGDPVGVGQHRASGAGGPAVEIKMGKADSDGGTVLVAGQVHEPAQRHADDIGRLIVRVGAVLSKGCDGHHDQLGVDLRQMLVAQAQSVQIAGGEGLDEEIGLGHQFLQQGLSVFLFQVQGDATFIRGVGPPE